jgi:hypothetical protein
LSVSSLSNAITPWIYEYFAASCFFTGSNQPFFISGACTDQNPAFSNQLHIPACRYCGKPVRFIVSYNT